MLGEGAFPMRGLCTELFIGMGDGACANGCRFRGDCIAGNSGNCAPVHCVGENVGWIKDGSAIAKSVSLLEGCNGSAQKR